LITHQHYEPFCLAAILPGHSRCEEGEHNDLATLFLSSSHHTIVKLFSMGHDPGEPYVTHFTQGSLALFVVIYIILMSVGAGVAIPGGLFMPSLIVSGLLVPLSLPADADGVLWSTVAQRLCASGVQGAHVLAMLTVYRSGMGVNMAGSAVHPASSNIHVCIPTFVLQVGAAWGGLWGSTLRSWLPHWNIQPGIYGVMAGASVLAGVFRSAGRGLQPCAAMA
jgi:H+/Cl- antiporter ClcA